MTNERAKARVGILISGRGSNMMSLVEAAGTPDYPAEISVVISNRPDAAGLNWAQERGLETIAIDHKRFSGRETFEAELQACLVEKRVDLVCLAGFMRLLTAKFVNAWQGRLLNIHPSLLPSFKGLDTHQRALSAGVKITGCTVHFVVPEMDAGPIIAQAAVGVRPGDDEAALAARILKAEHKLYPHALELVASGATSLTTERCETRPAPDTDIILFSPPLANGR